VAVPSSGLLVEPLFCVYVPKVLSISARTPMPPLEGIKLETTSYATFFVEVLRRSSSYIEVNFLIIVDFFDMLCL
jgi:hypothetical protein